ncbi:MAG: pyrroline-5-carboxylate reductase [Bdellovibrionaceae bacterium]|nr:pyrroline-5-carboxylate reductase [Pseudobdellovibrionaceae bacterium]NUM60113.1 pyrroline-5-carboxylate reductase [Pseudobdellovibrionaceae bacterium]
MLYNKATKVGFMGCGNMAQAVIKGLIEKKVLEAQHLFATNRSPGKLLKFKESYNIQICQTNEELVESADIVILAMKPQDLIAAIEPIASLFHEKQIVISLAAGITMNTLKKNLSQCRMIRMIPNTPSIIGSGLLGYVASEDVNDYLDTITEDLFSSLGKVVKLKDEAQLEAFMVACSSGTGFVYELMMYWNDWLQEHDFDDDLAKELTIETFLGASLLGKTNINLSLEDLQSKVTSKKGVTFAGLESIREQEIERSLRVAFEKSSIRNQELAKLLK